MTYDVLTDGSSSPLSSPASRSPSPPPGLSYHLPVSSIRPYPSPSSSQYNSAKASPLPDSMDSATVSAEEDGPPPAKRRKLVEPKPRTTQHLDLRAGVVEESEQPQLDRLLRAIHKKKKIVVIAGAGISVSTGIPDFRSSTGLFKTLRTQHNLKSSGKDLFDASVYKDGSSTSSFHDMIRSLSLKSKSAQPSAFHHLLATLAHEGRLLRLYSQNVDGIDTSLPPLATDVPLGKKGPWPKTIQLHGGLDKMVCTKCHVVSDFVPVLFDGPLAPLCKQCETDDIVRTEHAGKRSHGIGRLRPRMVLYNEHGPDDEAIGSVTTADLKARPDALIVVGTTLKVPGVKRIAKEMCNTVRDRRDGLTVWINNDPEPSGKDFLWDVVVRGPCDEVARLAALPRYDDEEARRFKEVTDAEVKKIKEMSGLKEVIVVSPNKSRLLQDAKMGVLTPLPSPTLQPLMELEAAALQKGEQANNSRTKGKPFADIQKQQGKAKNKKPAQKKASGATKKNGAAGTAPATKKITTSFGVSKPAATTGKAGGKGKKNAQDSRSAPNSKEEPPISIHLSLKPQGQPQSFPQPQLQTHSWHASVIETQYNLSRSTHPLTPEDTDTSPAHALAKVASLPNISLKLKIPGKSGGIQDDIAELEVRKKGRETISPRGTLPRGMSGIIDT